ncbi:MAG: type II toxin-antitoxin system VapC family toxin [Bryobacteraceae bacterium]|nr:type II toxin-antitoxin system VapC family toxin [Bryobacteraceae bacterium]
MITALDTNVLLDILIPDDQFAERSLAAIEAAAAGGSLVICDPVYAELCGQFRSQADCDRFLLENSILVERVSRQAMWAAASAWLGYRRTERRRDRILTDFLIGAHASSQASRLITRDRGVYRKYFKDLIVVDPSRI